jgi:hypothetical protein
MTYEALRVLWERSRAAERLAYSISGGKTRRVRSVRTREITAAMRAMHDLTRDAGYDHALRVIKQYGLSPERAITDHVMKLCVARMWRLVGSGRSLRVAAAQAAVEFHVPGRSFDGLVKRLERAWREEARARGRPKHQ